MNIYVASSWRNEIQPVVVEILRKCGHTVYDFKNPEPGNNGFQWSEVDPEWKKWKSWQFKNGLKHPIAEEGFKLDFDAMKDADCCVLVLPCGKSAHTEAGWMKGAGKKVYVFMPFDDEPELMYKIHDDILVNFDDLEKLGNAFT